MKKLPKPCRIFQILSVLFPYRQRPFLNDFEFETDAQASNSEVLYF